MVRKQHGTGENQGTKRSGRIVADGPVGLNADSCELPDSNLIIRKGARAPVDIVVAAEAGKITVDGVESQLKACDLDRAADPLYAQVLEGVFF